MRVCENICRIYTWTCIGNSEVDRRLGLIEVLLSTSTWNIWRRKKEETSWSPAPSSTSKGTATQRGPKRIWTTHSPPSKSETPSTSIPICWLPLPRYLKISILTKTWLSNNNFRIALSFPDHRSDQTMVSQPRPPAVGARVVRTGRQTQVTLVLPIRYARTDEMISSTFFLWSTWLKGSHYQEWWKLPDTSDFRGWAQIRASQTQSQKIRFPI